MSKCGPACETYNLAQGTHGEHVAWCELYNVRPSAKEITKIAQLREALRVAEAIRDDARAHSQRLLDEKRELAARLVEACQIADRIAENADLVADGLYGAADFGRLDELKKLGSGVP